MTVPNYQNYHHEINHVELYKRRMISEGKSLQVVKAQTLKSKLDNMFVDAATGANYEDVFRYMNASGIACGQNGDYAGFTTYLSWRWPHIKYMDLCHCKIPILRNPFPETMQNFVFPDPGSCKLKWRTTTLWKTNLENSTGQVYTTPGEKTRWVDYRSNGRREAYRPLTAQRINDLGGAYSLAGSYFFTHPWEKDPLLAAKEKSELEPEHYIEQ